MSKLHRRVEADVAVLFQARAEVAAVIVGDEAQAANRVVDQAAVVIADRPVAIADDLSGRIPHRDQAAVVDATFFRLSVRVIHVGGTGNGSGIYRAIVLLPLTRELAEAVVLALHLINDRVFIVVAREELRQTLAIERVAEFLNGVVDAIPKVGGDIIQRQPAQKIVRVIMRRTISVAVGAALPTQARKAKLLSIQHVKFPIAQQAAEGQTRSTTPKQNGFCDIYQFATSRLFVLFLWEGRGLFSLGSITITSHCSMQKTPI